MATLAELSATLGHFMPTTLASALAPKARIRTLRAGQIAVGHRDVTNEVYLVLEGALQAEVHSLNGREVILGELGPGDLFGEYAALDEQPRTADVTATSQCLLAQFPGAEFSTAVLATPDAATWIARQLVERIRQLTEKIFELNALAVRNRLHCELLRLCLHAGIDKNEAQIVPAPTHLQLASRIGTHREAVTRELGYLAGEGILAQDGRTLRILTVSELLRIVKSAIGEAEIVLRVGPLLSPD
ncbi:MAG: Crp/Fnr family transcriptional regulator [Pseudomonadota bacterium]